MKKVKLLSKVEMKNVSGGNVCATGNWNSYEICFNCSLAYGISLDQADRVCSAVSTT